MDRDTLVTVCHEQKVKGLKFDENALRLAMCHTQETAQTFYLRQDMTAVAARSATIIQRCTTVGQVAAAVAAPATVQQPTATPPAAQCEPERCQAEPDLVVPAGSLDPVLDPLPGLQTPNVGRSSDSEDLEEEEEPTRKLSQREKDIISAEFQDWIQSNKTVLLQEVQHRLRNECSVSLRKLLQVRGMDVKVANRIRHLPDHGAGLSAPTTGPAHRPGQGVARGAVGGVGGNRLLFP